jgi:hypothetical protein
MLKKFKIERIFYVRKLKIAFRMIHDHKLEMIKKEKETKIDQIRNFKALKFWCKITKRKVFR